MDKPSWDPEMVRTAFALKETQDAQRCARKAYERDYDSLSQAEWEQLLQLLRKMEDYLLLKLGIVREE